MFNNFEVKNRKAKEEYLIILYKKSKTVCSEKMTGDKEKREAGI